MLHFYFGLLLLFILKRDRERERNIDLLFHLLCIHWWILVCALTGIEPTTLAYCDDSNQLSYVAKPGLYILQL